MLKERAAGGRRRASDERGAALVLLAFMMVGLLTVTAIVIDGGNGYSSHRQMQNAADAAAMAGTRALQLAKFGAGSPDAVLAQATELAEKNGADVSDPSMFTCELINLTNGGITNIGSCSQASNPGLRLVADGVRVVTETTQANAFGSVAGRSSTTARGTAAATVQGVDIALGPWMVCGSPPLGGYDLLDSAGRLKDEATLRSLYGTGGSDLSDPRGIELHGKVSRPCGLSSDWKGLIDPDELVPPAGPPHLGDYVEAENGKKVGQYHYKDTLAGTHGCPDSLNEVDGTGNDDFGSGFDNCLVPVPVFDAVAGNRARIAAIAVFRVTYTGTGTIKYYGQFVCAQSCAALGGTSTEDNQSGLNVVKLVL